MMAALAALCFATLVLTISAGSAQLKNAVGFERPGWSETAPITIAQAGGSPSISRMCALQPERRRSVGKRSNPKPILEPGEPLNLERFRGPLLAATRGTATSDFTPREEIALIDATNYGDRFIKDVNGKLVPHEPIIVLHETVGSASSVVNYFRTPHPNDDDQVSYHVLVKLNGTLVYLVPPEKRAFGAGNSVFQGPNGLETVQTHPVFPPSVNNFAYHISLETPADGENNARNHSGYTVKQYQSLAWLTARTGIPDERITMHKLVDRSSSRIDPRSFNQQAFLQRLGTLSRTPQIALDCIPPPQVSETPSLERLPVKPPIKSPERSPGKP
jgi:N-acetylmuramoyl-L-alanine amidase